jgi:surface protein
MTGTNAQKVMDTGDSIKLPAGEETLGRIRNIIGDIFQWNVENVTNMRSMFKGAAAFNGDLSKWNVEKVTSMAQMPKPVAEGRATKEMNRPF